MLNSTKSHGKELVGILSKVWKLKNSGFLVVSVEIMLSYDLELSSDTPTLARF